MSDNEHTRAPLRQTEVLSVKHSPRQSVGVGVTVDDAGVLPPVFGGLDRLTTEEAQKSCKAPSLVVRQDTGDVLPNDPTGAIACSNRAKDEHERTSRVVESLAEAGDREGLAGGSADKNVN